MVKNLHFYHVHIVTVRSIFRVLFHASRAFCVGLHYISLCLLYFPQNHPCRGAERT